MFIDDDSMYSWGSGKYGQLGHGARFDERYPKRVEMEQHVLQTCGPPVSISAGDRHTCCITSKALPSYPHPRPHLHLHLHLRLYTHCAPIISMPISKMTFVERLKILSFGGGEHGQLGHGNGDDVMSPKIIEALSSSRCVQVSCGATNTAATTESGMVYVWGFGENLHPKDQPNIFYEPRLVRFKEKVKQVACGQSHIILLSGK